jgi:DNA repair protein RadC
MPITKSLESLAPREKLLARGAHSLEDAELIALVLGTGQRGKPAIAVAHELLHAFGGVSETLSAPWEQIGRQPGIGLARYAAIQASRELARRAAAEPFLERPVMGSPDSVSQFLVSQIGGLSREVFAVLFLDSRHRLIRFETLFSGTLTQTSVYPREVAKRALQLNAAAVIAAHNHPSGSAQPSQADQLLTAQLRRTLSAVDIVLLDHLIVAGGQTAQA